MSGAKSGGWSIEQHVCRACGGRLLSRDAGEQGDEYRCSNCGTTATGRRPWVLCGCGIRIRGAVDAGLRCRPNPERTPESPGEIVVMPSS